MQNILTTDEVKAKTKKKLVLLSMVQDILDEVDAKRRYYKEKIDGKMEVHQWEEEDVKNGTMQEKIDALDSIATTLCTAYLH